MIGMYDNGSDPQMYMLVAQAKNAALRRFRGFDDGRGIDERCSRDPDADIRQRNADAVRVRLDTWYEETFDILEIVWGRDKALQKIGDRKPPRNLLYGYRFG